MIEVNLLPGGQKRASARRRRRSFTMPSMQGVPGDRWVLGAGLLVLVALASIAWMHQGVSGQAEELRLEIGAAELDSARLAGVIERTGGLQARRDSIAGRVSVIQEIDTHRYLWPHVMDEVARALPAYTWLTRIQQISGATPVIFEVRGQAGTYFALTSFMEALESSPFVRGVRLIASDQASVAVGGGAQRLVYNFALEAEYRDPPPEVIETEPLFGPSIDVFTSQGG
jgi:Tfp pilus assembly protein PilN